MPFAHVGDATLFFTDEGTGDPLLFVHGYACDSHDWSWQLPHFAERHRVIAVDIRGHGRSSVPDSGYEPVTFASDLAMLIEQLGCGPVVAIGHSLGGVIVSTLAVERPELVQAVVNIDPGYLFPDEWGGLIAPALKTANTTDPVPVVQNRFGSMHTPASPAAMKTWHMRRVAGMPHHVLRQAMASGAQGMALMSNSAPYLAQRRCPVLTLWADTGRAAVEVGLFADDRSRVVTFEGSGHWIHQERPAEVNHIIETWLASLQAQSRP
jgi:pimeloyl-ACP methyl ester carboxylesterase